MQRLIGLTCMQCLLSVQQKGFWFNGSENHFKTLGNFPPSLLFFFGFGVGGLVGALAQKRGASGAATHCPYPHLPRFRNKRILKFSLHHLPSWLDLSFNKENILSIWSWDLNSWLLLQCVSLNLKVCYNKWPSKKLSKQKKFHTIQI